ncbi:hypothetical protein ABKN59_004648 [Abortiporus biennis]
MATENSKTLQHSTSRRDSQMMTSQLDSNYPDAPGEPQIPDDNDLDNLDQEYTKEPVQIKVIQCNESLHSLRLPSSDSGRNEEDCDTKGSRGWNELSKTLRNYDEKKIQGYKEDMDTLLVFAAFNPNYNLSQYDIHSYRKQSVKIYLAKFWDLGRDLNVYVQKRLSLHLPHTPYFSTFRYRMLSFRHWHPFVNESLIRASPSLDIPSLVAADNIFMDDDFLAIAARCISNADLHDAVSFTRSALLNRLGSNLDNIASSAVREYFRGYPSTASLLRGAVLDALIGTLHKLDSQRGMDGIGAIIELKEAKLYQVLSFLTATSYTSRKEDIGKACSKLFCINSDMAAHIVYVVCQQLNEVNYLESIRINTDQALANFSSGIEIWATYYTRLLNGVPNPDPIDDHCARIGNTPDKLAFVFLSLLQRVRDDLLLGHERTLKQVQGKLAFVLERIDRLERNNDDESILIMYCDGRDVSDKPLRLLLELEDRVPGIIEPRLGTALSAVSSWSSQPLLPQTVEPNEATDISRLTGIIVEHCASIAEPEAESVYGKDDMEE